MILNTKTGVLRMTKSEQSTLRKAIALLEQIEQHAEPEVTKPAGEACDNLEMVLRELTDSEATTIAPATTA